MYLQYTRHLAFFIVVEVQIWLLVKEGHSRKLDEIPTWKILSDIHLWDYNKLLNVTKHNMRNCTIFIKYKI